MRAMLEWPGREAIAKRLLPLLQGEARWGGQAYRLPHSLVCVP